MRIRTMSISIAVALLTLALVLTVSAGISGTTEPPGPPDSTASYTLEDIYNRLDSGAAGSPITFTEPSSGPGMGTGYSLDEVMAKAPAADNTHGAVVVEVLTGTTYWSLRTDGGGGSSWGMMTGTMPNNGAVTIVPTTTNQAIAPGYHDGTGYVEGDMDLVTVNIVSDVVIFGVTGTYPLAPIPKTGQTISYGARDDGELRMGVAWPSPRFTDNDDGTVTDNLTGLIWLKNANCFGTRNWTTALSDANNLANGSCGLSDGSSAGDWRLPNVRELHSLMDSSRYGPALPNGHPFIGAQSSYYWSGSTSAPTPSNAWRVNVFGGGVTTNDKADTHYVWPVRGGQ